MSFYRYARRLRDRANLAELAALTADDDAEVDARLRKLVSRRLIELMLNQDDASPKDIGHLTSALRAITSVEIQDRRFKEECGRSAARLRHDREQLRLQADHLLKTRRQLMGLSAQAQGRRPFGDDLSPDSGKALDRPPRSDDPSRQLDADPLPGLRGPSEPSGAAHE